MPAKYILDDDNNEHFTNKFEAYKYRKQRLYDDFQILQGYSKHECQQLIKQIENLAIKFMTRWTRLENMTC